MDKISDKEYEERKFALQCELLKWQQHVKDENTQHIVICEGRDGAGKTSFIKRAFMEHLNSRTARVVALDKPTEQERAEWYWQRYIRQFPRAGEITVWDRSWYNRATVEPVMGFSTGEQTEHFLKECPKLERIWVQAGIKITKFWFSVTRQEQEIRFKEREIHPLKLGKLSSVDLASANMWDEYTRAKDIMFKRTSRPECPWIQIDSNCKKSARLAGLQYILLKNNYPNRNLKNIGSINTDILKVIL